MNNKIQRYDWEDAIVCAQRDKVISNGALLVALKLSMAINWCPKDNRPSGLYWDNESALKHVGASRASFYKFRQDLMNAGFFTEDKGNLIPTLPKSLVETDAAVQESSLKTTESVVKTRQSLLHNPYSVDTYSDDSCSEELIEESESFPVGEANGNTGKAGMDDGVILLENTTPERSGGVSKSSQPTDADASSGDESFLLVENQETDAKLNVRIQTMGQPESLVETLADRQRERGIQYFISKDQCSREVAEEKYDRQQAYLKTRTQPQQPVSVGLEW